MLFFIDHAGVQLNFFNLFLDDKGVVFPLLNFSPLSLCRRLLRIRLGGRLLGGSRRSFQFAGAQLSTRRRRLLRIRLLSSLLRWLLSIRRLGSLRRLCWRALHFGRTQRLARLSRRLLGLALILGVLRGRGCGSALR